MKQAILSGFVASLALASSVSFAETVDQNAPTDNAYLAAFSQGGLAQSFEEAAGNVSGAGIFLEPYAGHTDTVTISLYNKLPTAGGSLLAQATGLGTQGTWFDAFWSPVSVTPGATYFLVFSGNTTLGIAGDTHNHYARGEAYANPGFHSFPAFDYTFRTYSSSVTPVPEPETYALLMAGLVAMGLFARGRKSARSVATA